MFFDSGPAIRKNFGYLCGSDFGLWVGASGGASFGRAVDCYRWGSRRPLRRPRDRRDRPRPPVRAPRPPRSPGRPEAERPPGGRFRSFCKNQMDLAKTSEPSPTRAFLSFSNDETNLTIPSMRRRKHGLNLLRRTTCNSRRLQRTTR